MEVKSDFDPSLITPPIDQGKLPLSDPLTSEGLAQSRRGIMLAITGILIIAIVGVAYFIWNNIFSNENSATPRIIAASKSPMKEFPETDESIADQNEGSTFFAIINGNGSEPNENLILPEPTEIPKVLNSFSSEIQSEPVQSTISNQEQTVTVRPDGSTVGETLKSLPPDVQTNIQSTSPTGLTTDTETDDTEIKITIPAPEDPISFNSNELESVEQNDNSNTNGEIIIPFPKLKPEFNSPSNETEIVTNQQHDLSISESVPLNNELPQVGEISRGTPVVQILARRSIAVAQQSYIALKNDHPDIFENLTPIIQESNDKDWYRVRIPMESSSAANEFCNRLKIQNIISDCFVSQN